MRDQPARRHDEGRAESFSPDDLRIVEFESVSMREWISLTGHDRAVFGEASAGLTFRPKTLHIGLRDPDDQLLAVAGATTATVEVSGAAPFEVVALGALVVRPELRGLGLGGRILDRFDVRMTELGPDRAMVLCEPKFKVPYGRRGFHLLTDTVLADQPDGHVVVPLSAMWRSLGASDWPPGRIHIQGLPF